MVERRAATGIALGVGILLLLGLGAVVGPFIVLIAAFVGAALLFSRGRRIGMLVLVCALGATGLLVLLAWWLGSGD
jgi:hypothetical protein